jgi:hypothetical protein
MVSAWFLDHPVKPDDDLEKLPDDDPLAGGTPPDPRQREIPLDSLYYCHCEQC